MPDPDLASANVTLAGWAARLRIPAFFTWWRGELAAAVPSRLRAAIAERRLRPVIAFDGERIGVWRALREGDSVRMREVASVAANADAATLAAQGRAALDAIFAGQAGERDVTLALAQKLVLRRRVTLPAAVEESLRATIGYDLDRLTPFKAEEVAFDAVVAERDGAKRTIGVDLVAVRRRTLDQALAQARAFGANVVAVVDGAPRDAAASKVNLLDPEDRSGSGRFLRWQVLVPLAILAALLVAALAVPLWQKRELAIAMMNTADAASIRAQESDRLRSELDRMVGQYNFALERKYTTPGVAQVLNELSGLLPDDTWLTHFEVKSMIRGKVTQREVYMRGESANAGKLISLLENATLVGNATPRSPTTKLNPGPGESFDIGAQLKSTPMPAKLALTETLPAPRRAAVVAPAAAPPAPPAAAAPAAAAPTAAAPSAGVAHVPASVPTDEAAGDAAKAGGDAAATAGETPSAAKAARAARSEARRARGRNGRAAPPTPAPPAPAEAGTPPAHPAGTPAANGMAPADTEGEAPEDADPPEDAQ
jgi:general secretion pathway protein L